MSDKLIRRNGESVEIDSIIKALESAPDKAEVLDALKALRQDRVKEAVNQTVKAARFDLGEVFGEFLLDGEKAERTQDTYRIEIGRFITWLERESLHVLQVRRADVNRFKAYLSERYSPNTVRLVLASASSFWKYLEAERYIEHNPFSNIKYPRKEYKKAVQPNQGSPIPVMSEEEYQAIMEALKNKVEASGGMVYDRASRESARRLLPVVHFMKTYGLRIGDVLTVRLEEAGRFSYRQKGGQVRQKNLQPISQEILAESGNMKRQPFKDLVQVTVQMSIRRLTLKLTGQEVIRYAYSCHDFRHLYAVNLYQKTGDIYKVKEGLGHATVAVTEIYLAGLGALGES